MTERAGRVRRPAAGPRRGRPYGVRSGRGLRSEGLGPAGGGQGEPAGDEAEAADRRDRAEPVGGPAGQDEGVERCRKRRRSRTGSSRRPRSTTATARPGSPAGRRRSARGRGTSGNGRPISQVIEPIGVDLALQAVRPEGAGDHGEAADDGADPGPGRSAHELSPWRSSRLIDGEHLAGAATRCPIVAIESRRLNSAGGSGERGRKVNANAPGAGRSASAGGVRWARSPPCRQVIPRWWRPWSPRGRPWRPRARRRGGRRRTRRASAFATRASAAGFFSARAVGGGLSAAVAWSTAAFSGGTASAAASAAAFASARAASAASFLAVASASGPRAVAEGVGGGLIDVGQRGDDRLRRPSSGRPSAASAACGLAGSAGAVGGLLGGDPGGVRPVGGGPGGGGEGLERPSRRPRRPGGRRRGRPRGPGWPRSTAASACWSDGRPWRRPGPRRP